MSPASRVLIGSLRRARAANADLWVFEMTNGAFADHRAFLATQELVGRVYGVERAGSVTYQSRKPVAADRYACLVGFEPGVRAGRVSLRQDARFCAAITK
jgi:putative ABC transport system permease protein